MIMSRQSLSSDDCLTPVRYICSLNLSIDSLLVSGGNHEGIVTLFDPTALNILFTIPAYMYLYIWEMDQHLSGKWTHTWAKLHAGIKSPLVSLGTCVPTYRRQQPASCLVKISIPLFPVNPLSVLVSVSEICITKA